MPEPVAHGGPREAAGTAMETLTALERLPPRQRATVVLRYCERLTVEETADAMRCSTGTVKSRSSKTVQAPRRLLPATPQPEYHGR